MEKTNNSLSLKLIDFDNSQIDNFAAILDLAHFGLEDEWHITNSSHPDFCVFNGSENSASKKIPKNRCFYYLPDEDKSKKNKTNAILHDKLHVPLVHKLIDTLNSGAAKIDTHQDKESFFEMVPLLKKIIETNEPLVIGLTDNKHQDQDKLYIDPKNRIFYHLYSIEKIYEDLFSGQAVSVENISREDINVIANESDFRPRATKDLMWHIAFTASNGKLINELSEHEIIHLGKWPYLGLESQKYMKIAEYFKSHAASLSTMIAELGIAPSIANDFYNASYLAGHIDTQETANITRHRDSTTGGLNIFDKIKNLF